ncbi:Phosphoglycerate kinase [Gemmatirosa kalamazoonensis]|uniref:Phosphoglycerate kinase n=1 Tax=Gemmatirosa kalamazoonensis TaxID=861299 RepID=W0RJA1_9BACT|nr:phosphoglycerate kinase [Gemmatirosa kalamazoonensis]AHG90846.1 Phosphoglycerate kinase [Gemmatirosa kalamazoonensis]
MATKTIRDLTDEQLRGKRALVRVDFNVPLDGGKVGDDTRIVAALPTIQYLVERGARVVLFSHLGRPKAAPDPKYSMRPVAERLAELMPGTKVEFCPASDGDEAVQCTERLQPGGVVVLENTRFLPGEEKNDPALSKAFARLGDVYVNDAFGSAHRAHASTEGVAHLLRPAVAGFLMEKELAYLGQALSDPKRPFVAILGGAKISGKLDVIEQLLPKVDRMLIGGAMANTFFKAMGLETGTSLVEDDRVEMAKSLLSKGGDKLVLPVDAVVAPELKSDARTTVVARDAVPADQAMYDVGPRTVDAFAKEIRAAKTVVWNGPMGVFETPPFDAGTLGVARALAEATAAGATTVVGGGDSAAAIAQAGLEDRVTHVSTGGGASLEFLEGKVLPGVAALDTRDA